MKTVSSVITFIEHCSCPPSWTQHFVGKHHAFVVGVISSSDDLSMRLNVYSSGSF